MDKKCRVAKEVREGEKIDRRKKYTERKRDNSSEIDENEIKRQKYEREKRDKRIRDEKKK